LESDRSDVTESVVTPVSGPTLTDAPMPATAPTYDQQAVIEDHTVAEEQVIAEDRSVVEKQAAVEEQAVVVQSIVEKLETEAAIAAGQIENISAIANVADPADGARNAPEASPDVSPSSGGVLNEAFESDVFSRLTLSESLSNPPLPRHEIPYEQASDGELVSEPLLPSQAYSQEIVAGPEEDPADLFEPMPMPSPVNAVPVGEASEPDSEPDISPQRANMSEATRSVPRTAASDPLTAVRNLSEEELIALFT
jgi:hypothetical protein